MEIKGIDGIPMFNYIPETKEFYVLGNKIDDVNSVDDFIKYITNLQLEVVKLNNHKRGMLVQLFKANNKLLEANEKIIKATEYNKQIIEDTKTFYRPTSDIIYSGDSLIDIATHNLNILHGSDDNEWRNKKIFR